MSQKDRPAGRDVLKSEYHRFKVGMEHMTGVTIDKNRLKQSIAIVNNKRKAIHRLSSLRKANPVPVSGLDALLANQIFIYDNPAGFTESVNKLCDELEKRVKNKKQHPFQNPLHASLFQVAPWPYPTQNPGRSIH